LKLGITTCCTFSTDGISRVNPRERIETQNQFDPGKQFSGYLPG